MHLASLALVRLALAGSGIALQYRSHWNRSNGSALARLALACDLTSLVLPNFIILNALTGIVLNGIALARLASLTLACHTLASLALTNFIYIKTDFSKSKMTIVRAAKSQTRPLTVSKGSLQDANLI